jgi:hypothetical protein
LPKDLIEREVLGYVGQKVQAFLENGGDRLLAEMVRKAFGLAQRNRKDRRREIERRIATIERDIDRLLGSLTPALKYVIEKKILQLQEEQRQWQARLEELASAEEQHLSVETFADEIARIANQFDRVFQEGTLEEQKDFLRLFVERIEVIPRDKKARVHIRQFPAPQSLDTGKCLSVLVAGARSEHQKKPFPPVDVVEMALVCKGRGARTLAPAST